MTAGEEISGGLYQRIITWQIRKPARKTKKGNFKNLLSPI